MKRLAIALVICSIVSISLSFPDGPPLESGPFVTRHYVDGFPLDGWIFHIDWDARLMAVYGIDPVELCQGGGEFEPVSVLQIQAPAAIEAIIHLVKADDMTVSVWEGASCSFILNNPPVATGTVDMVSNDNDLLSFLNPETNRANAFAFSAHGSLRTPRGETVRFSAHSKCVWDGRDGTRQNRCGDKIKVAGLRR